jgi:type II secretory pathway pseudopilin PulG
MSRKLPVAIAIVSSSVALASPAFAGQTTSDRNYWTSEVAANSLQAKTTSAGPLSSFAFDNSGPQFVHVTISGKSNGPYQGGPHPR